MPTSNVPETEATAAAEQGSGIKQPFSKRHRKLHVALKIILSLVVFIACDVLISYVLVPYGTKSEVMWWEYRQTDELDTIIIGDSLTQRGFDPDIIDPIAGTDSLNMATNGQEAVESYIALRQAFKDHPEVDRVIYGLELSMLTKTPRAAHLSGFLTEKWKDESASEIYDDLKYALRGEDFISTPDSINIIFPWVKQHCYFQNVPRNIKSRLDGLDPGQASSVNDEDWTYIDNGFGGYSLVLDYNTITQTNYMNFYHPREIREENMAHLLEICRLCKENDVEMIAVAPPMPDFNLFAMKDKYEEFYGQIEEELASEGVRFYNFNLAKDELFESVETDYMDWEHLNLRGGQRLSRSMAQLILADQAGEDLGQYFYSLDERLDHLDTISRVALKLKRSDDGKSIEVKATPATGPKTKVEYEFRAREKDKGTFEVIQEYSGNNKLTWTPPRKGAWEVRVYARLADSPVKYGKYHTQVLVL
ncbi:MAG: hypothetical protein ACOYIP_02365 [Coriobacteriales bacterium]|jgi:hypothetical protein